MRVLNGIDIRKGMSRRGELITSISQRPRDQQVEFRNDCIGANWLYNEIAEIYPPS